MRIIWREGIPDDLKHLSEPIKVDLSKLKKLPGAGGINVPFYTPPQAAELIGIHEESVRRLIRQKKLRGFKVGKGWRIRQIDLDEYLDGKR